MENAGYLFTAFSIVWALVFGYVLLLSIRQRNQQREISALKEIFKKNDKEK
jgi:CcmD family protein